MKNWDVEQLWGTWAVSYKIDGVRMLRDGTGKPVSRAGKPLHGLQDVHLSIVDAEIFAGSWEKSVSAVRTIDAEPVPIEWVYSLDPLDPRLAIGTYTDPTVKEIKKLMAVAVRSGYEGIVLRQEDSFLKVKPVETHDVEVLGILLGKGKHTGRTGALVTSMGNVGTGLTDEDRVSVKIGDLVEVAAQGLTPSGRFRHPRFVRVRPDKVLN